MLHFKEVTLSDKKEFDQILRPCNLRSSDYNFNNIYLWSKPYGIRACIYSGCLILQFRYRGNTVFSFPAGKKSAAAIDEILDFCKREGIVPRIGCLTTETSELLGTLYPGQFSLVRERAYDDYLYTVTKLSDLSGKKMHAKRNFINRFIQDYPDWRFEVISDKNMDECRMMDDEWLEVNTAERHANYDDEAHALELMFNHYDFMELEGGLIRAGGKVVAFTVGEKLCSDTWNTHFEKAFSHIPGTYAMINREYAAYIRKQHPEIVYINREDDLGQENLRKAKESYYPDLMVEKYTAVFDNL